MAFYLRESVIIFYVRFFLSEKSRLKLPFCLFLSKLSQGEGAESGRSTWLAPNLMIRYLFRPALLRLWQSRASPATLDSRASQVPRTYPNTQQIFDRKEEQDSGPCEDLSLSAEEGYGYYPSAVVGHQLGQYKIVRKVCVSMLAGWHGSSPHD